jgi:hypothetical protein
MYSAQQCFRRQSAAPGAKPAQQWHAALEIAVAKLFPFSKTKDGLSDFPFSI